MKTVIKSCVIALAIATLAGHAQPMHAPKPRPYTPEEIVRNCSLDGAPREGINRFFHDYPEIAECLQNYKKRYIFSGALYYRALGNSRGQFAVDNWKVFRTKISEHDHEHDHGEAAKAVLQRKDEDLDANIFIDFVKAYGPEVKKSHEELMQLLRAAGVVNLAPCETDATGRETGLPGKIYVLASEEYWPGYVLKISCSHMLDSDYPDAHLRESRMWPNPQQNVSRVFYSYKINQFIKHEHLGEHFYPIHEYLYRVPWSDQDCALNDDNFYVVAERVPDDLLITPQENYRNYNRLVTFKAALEPRTMHWKDGVETDQINPYYEKEVKNYRENIGYRYNAYINEGYEEFVEAFARVITHAGLWDLGVDNVLIIFRGGKFEAIFLDIERPTGGGGAPREHFFHQDPVDEHGNWRVREDGKLDSPSGFFLNGNGGVGCVGDTMAAILQMLGYR